MAVHGREATWDPAVRERLLAVARDAFADQGYERASLNAILADAGVGKGSFYYFFRDKEDLFATVLEEGLARIESASGPWALPETADAFWPGLVALTTRWVAAGLAEPRFLELARAMQPLRRSASARLAAVMDRSRALYRAGLARGVALGVVRSDLPVDTLVALIEAMDVAMDDELHQGPVGPDELAAHRDRMVDLVRRLVQP
jgi:AcrR family transcriptional regulator